MDPMQPWVRLEKLEGMEDKDGQKIGLPDLPKGTRQAGGARGRMAAKREGFVTLQSSGVW